MAITETVGYGKHTRKIEIFGDPGSKFEIHVKQGSNYYNWDTNNFQTKEKILKSQEIDSSGEYVRNIIIPEVTSDTSYDFFVRPLPGTTSKLDITSEQKIGILFQKGSKVLTFTTTTDDGLTIAATLTGGTVNSESVFSQTGAITKSGGALLYVHTTPTWNRNDGGNWTNSSFVTTNVVSIEGTKLIVEDGTYISSGHSIVGDNIIDATTVSAISGNIVTLSTSPKLEHEQQVSFSEGGWQIGGITAVMSLSGTASVTMLMNAIISAVGVADVTSECDIDSFVSIKPNAFPVSNITCPFGGSVTINPVLECTNYLGTPRDNDANQAAKEYALGAVPSASTSSVGNAERPETFGKIINVDAEDLTENDSLGDTGAAGLIYRAGSEMEEGVTDYFYYKVSNLGGSSTTQGKISITIV